MNKIIELITRIILALVVCQLLSGCSLASYRAPLELKDVSDNQVSSLAHIKGKIEITPATAEQFYLDGH